MSISNKEMVDITDEFLRDAFNELPNPKPILIISFGPPASGKSRIIKYFIDNVVKAKENVNKKIKPFVNINIDDILYRFDEYTKERLHVASLLPEFWLQAGITADFEKNCQNYLNKIQAASELFSAQYTKYRPYGNKIRTSLIALALLYNLNIIAEIAALGDFTWLKQYILNDAVTLQYNIYLVYPYVDNECSLQYRNVIRSQNEGRLVPPSMITESYNNQMPLLNEIMESFKIDNIFIYDNSTFSDKPEELFTYSTYYYLKVNCTKKLIKYPRLMNGVSRLKRICENERNYEIQYKIYSYVAYWERVLNFIKIKWMRFCPKKI